ncbi:MAG: transcription elongation factor GreA [Patescibacteria group bacterium]
MKKRGDILLTKEGKEKLEKEMADLRMNRPKILEDLQRARSQGDLRENAAYHAARENLSNTDRRIVTLELTLRNSTVVEKSNSDDVQIGSKVTLDLEGKTMSYEIVGEAEGDIKAGKITHKSPLAQKLLGKKKGATITLHTPNGEKTYTILTVK